MFLIYMLSIVVKLRNLESYSRSYLRSFNFSLERFELTKIRIVIGERPYPTYPGVLRPERRSIVPFGESKEP